jgi:uncharacterized protein YeaO (DUF488 family)
MNIRIKRAYDQPAKTDGDRILVDRLWPRGLTKEKASVDLWLKEIAPTTELRKWFDHDPDKWEEFRKRYINELKDNIDSVERLHEMAKDGMITLLYAARDEQHNEALVLKQVLESGI